MKLQQNNYKTNKGFDKMYNPIRREMIFIDYRGGEANESC